MSQHNRIAAGIVMESAIWVIGILVDNRHQIIFGQDFQDLQDNENGILQADLHDISCSLASILAAMNIPISIRNPG
jgi:hypothetical protein